MNVNRSPKVSRTPRASQVMESELIVSASTRTVHQVIILVVEPHSEPEGSSEPASESEPVSDDRMYKPHAYAPKHDFNPMDCTDIVIGAARNQTSRVFDYYTRDRSTPRQDEFWGGANDLTASAGFEENGVTTIIFRRKLTSTDVTDHSIVNDLMHVIWARGEIFQPQGMHRKGKLIFVVIGRSRARAICARSTIGLGKRKSIDA